MSGLNHRLGVPVLGSCAEETSPVGCLENQCDRKAGAPRLRLGGVWVLACHQTGQREVYPSSCCHATPPQSKPSECYPAHSKPQLGPGSQAFRTWERVNQKIQRCPGGQGCRLDRAVSIAGAYSNSTQEIAQT